MNLPRWIAALPVRLRSIVSRRRAEKDLDDELSFHLAMKARAARDAGISEAEAARQARLAFGGLRQTKERCRDAWPLRWVEDLVHDLRYAVRGLRRSPAFTSIAVTVLALGIGATTALFSVISAVLLRPLTYPDANRLVRIWSAMPSQGYPRSGSSLPDYRTWRDANHSFDAIGASHNTAYNLTGVDRPQRLLATRMTASMWEVLRPTPLVGGLFSADAEQWGRHRVVVLDEGLWRRQFGADPAIVGRTLLLSGQPFLVMGVVPTSFEYPDAGTEIWTPESYAPGDAMDTRANHFVDVIGRLKPGVTVTQAQADLALVAAQIRQQFPENAGIDVTMQSWRETIVGDVRPTLLLLLGAVALVLLIACTNVANLVLARSIARRQELTFASQSVPSADGSRDNSWPKTSCWHPSARSSASGSRTSSSRRSRPSVPSGCPEFRSDARPRRRRLRGGAGDAHRTRSRRMATTAPPGRGSCERPEGVRPFRGPRNESRSRAPHALDRGSLPVSRPPDWRGLLITSLGGCSTWILAFGPITS